MIKTCKKILSRLKEYVSPDHGIRHAFIKRPLILALFSLLFAVPISANEQKKIIVLNSDMSIDRYSLAQTEFKSKIADLKAEIDLGSKWLDETVINKSIRDTSPDLVYCIGTKAYMFAHRLVKDENLVFSSAINWRRLPLGKNTYGISNELPQGMQLTMYRYLFPDVDKIGVLYSKEYNKEWTKEAIKVSKDMEINIIEKAIKKPKDVGPALDKLLSKVDAIWLTPDPIVMQELGQIKNIFTQCNQAGKPVFTYSEAFVGLGATLVLSADTTTIGRQAAALTLDILNGREITEKVQNPAGSYIILNLKKVEEYKINLNLDALGSVNKIIK